MRALGIVSDNLSKCSEKIGVTVTIDLWKKAALLGTSIILRRNLWPKVLTHSLLSNDVFPEVIVTVKYSIH